MKQQDHYLITGATGFVGRAVATGILVGGGIVKAMVRHLPQDFPIEVELVQGDMNDFVGDASRERYIDSAKTLFWDIGVVIHCAARVHIIKDDSVDPLIEFRNVNRDATLTLARMAADAGVKRFIFLSSIGVNGNNNTHPFTESDSPNPQEPYAVSKYEAEEELLALAKTTEMEVVIIRPPLVYGENAPGNFGSLMKWMNKSIPLPFGAIHNKRSLVALDNLVSFIIHCADYKKTPQAANQVFLISDGEDVSTTELLQKVAKAFGKKALLLPIPVSLMTLASKLLGKGDVANRLFGSLQVDSSKARELLGWKPVITMDEQLKKTADAYLAKKKN